MIQKTLPLALALAFAASEAPAQDSMTFFLTSQGPGDGANLGGLASR